MRLLNDGQKENRVQVCQDILKQLEITPDLLSRVYKENSVSYFTVIAIFACFISSNYATDKQHGKSHFKLLFDN